MTDGAGGQVAAGIAEQIDRRRRSGGDETRRGRQAGVPHGHGATIVVAETPGHRGHHRIGTPAVGVVVQLFAQIAGVQPRQPGRADSVPLAVQPVTEETGVRRASMAAAHGQQLAGLGELAAGIVDGRRAARKGGGQAGRGQALHATGDEFGFGRHTWANRRGPHRFPPRNPDFAGVLARP